MIVKAIDDIYKNQDSEVIPWPSMFFIVTVLLMPHILVLHSALPLKIFEKSLWLGIFLIFILFCSGIALVKLKESKLFLWTSLSALMQIFISIIRSDVYELNIIGELVNSRALVTIPLMLVAAIYYLKDRRVATILIWGIILTGFSQAVIGIMHKYIFPEIVTGTFASYEGKLFYVDSIRGRAFYSRESGTFGNPSQYADMICLSACLFAWMKPKFKNISNIVNLLFQLSFYVVLLAGLLPSLCRLPIVFTLIFFLLFFVEAGLVANFKKLIIPGILLIFALVAFVFYQYPQLVQRFLSIGAYGRFQKNELLFNYLTSNLQYFLIGITQEVKTSLRTLENLGFGDNSYLQLFASIGFPVLVTWGILLITFLRSEFKIDLSILKMTFLFFVVVNFYIGDTVYADGWSMFLFLSLVLFFTNHDHKISPVSVA